MIAAMSPTRVAVADDDVLLREGIASLLERSGFEVVGQAGDAHGAAGAGSRARAGAGDRRHPHAAQPRDRGARCRAGDPRGDAGDRRSSCCPRTWRSTTRWSCSREASESATCSRAGSPTSTSSSRRVERIVQGGSVVDPALVQELVAASAATIRSRAHSARARGARAHGRGPLERRHRAAAVGHRGHGREARAQHPHRSCALPETDDDHRRVLAVITFLEAR